MTKGNQLGNVADWGRYDQLMNFGENALKRRAAHLGLDMGIIKNKVQAVVAIINWEIENPTLPQEQPDVIDEPELNQAELQRPVNVVIPALVWETEEDKVTGEDVQFTIFNGVRVEITKSTDNVMMYTATANGQFLAHRSFDLLTGMINQALANKPGDVGKLLDDAKRAREGKKLRKQTTSVPPASTNDTGKSKTVADDMKAVRMAVRGIKEKAMEHPGEAYQKSVTSSRLTIHMQVVQQEEELVFQIIGRDPFDSEGWAGNFETQDQKSFYAELRGRLGF